MPPKTLPPATEAEEETIMSTIRMPVFIWRWVEDVARSNSISKTAVIKLCIQDCMHRNAIEIKE